MKSKRNMFRSNAKISAPRCSKNAVMTLDRFGMVVSGTGVVLAVGAGTVVETVANDEVVPLVSVITVELTVDPAVAGMVEVEVMELPLPSRLGIGMKFNVQFPTTK